MHERPGRREIVPILLFREHPNDREPQDGVRIHHLCEALGRNAQIRDDFHKVRVHGLLLTDLRDLIPEMNHGRRFDVHVGRGGDDPPSVAAVASVAMTLVTLANVGDAQLPANRVASKTVPLGTYLCTALTTDGISETGDMLRLHVGDPSVLCQFAPLRGQWIRLAGYEDEHK